jgi:hypothetical protein
MSQTVPPVSKTWDDDCQLYHHGLVASSTGNQRLLETLRVEDLTWKPVMIFGLVNNFAHRYRQCDDTLSSLTEPMGHFTWHVMLWLSPSWSL